jgi:hypothetical protein
MADNSYRPQTKVNWTSNDAFAQFKLWRKEVERILNGPLEGKSALIQINHIFIWAGAHAETLIEARQNEDPDLKLETSKALLDELAQCLTHSTFFREARENFYTLKQTPGDNTTTYYSRIMELYKQAEFPDSAAFLIVDKLIHGSTNKDTKRKLMCKKKDATVKECLTILRQEEAVDTTMKRLEDSNQAAIQLRATYSRDPTKCSQQNGDKRKSSSKHRFSKRSCDEDLDERPCIWCKGNPHPREKCPANNAKCNF